MTSYNYLSLFGKNNKDIAVLIDPDKSKDLNDLMNVIRHCESAKIDYLFIGGSTGTREEFQYTVNFIKTNCTIPLIIFPGSPKQLSPQADAILFLSLISGRNPYYLIESQIESAEDIAEMKLNVIPTSYLLIDGGTNSSVAYVSQTTPIPSTRHAIIYKTALAGSFLGHKATYLDAGSGAKTSVPVAAVRMISEIGTTVIVGGGIKSIDQIKDYHEAGASIVVIGNHIETHPDFLMEIKEYKKV